jgi:hypothetical protein
MAILMCKHRCNLWILNNVSLCIDLGMWMLMLYMDELYM